MTVESEEAVPAQRIKRQRHHPRAGAVFLGSLLLAGALIAFLLALFFTAKLFMTSDRQWAIWALGSVLAFVGLRLTAFIQSRNIACSLCHGTILHERRCRKHASATRIPGLSYRAAIVLCTLFTASFRCMYCGTKYRLRE